LLTIALHTIVSIMDKNAKKERASSNNSIWISFPIDPKVLDESRENILNALKEHLEGEEALVPTDAQDEVQDRIQHLITVRDLHDNPTRIRYWLAHGHELVLARRGKVICYIRPYTAEDRAFDDRVKGERMLITLDEIRTHMDDFAFRLEDGFELIIGHYSNRLGIATNKVPEDVLNALKEEIKVITKTELRTHSIEVERLLLAGENLVPGIKGLLE
jgi:hypothetical protein